jgi:hypothetical protein
MERRKHVFGPPEMAKVELSKIKPQIRLLLTTVGERAGGAWQFCTKRFLEWDGTL